MIDYITGNKFKELVDQLSKRSTFFKDIIFCRTLYAPYIFQTIKNNGKKYIIVTHDGDDSVKERDYIKKPNNVVCWYASCCAYDAPDLTPIPRGLQNEYDYNADPGVIEIYKQNFDRWNNRNKIEDIVYCNWTNGSNPIRPGILPKLDKNNIKYEWFENYAAKGIYLGRYEYFNKISEYKFVLSPPGSNNDDPTHCDCHRTWEIIYAGSIPIVIKNNLFKEYDDFPIIQVNDYSEVTYDLLNSYLNKEFNDEKKNMDYWRKRITKKFNEI